jgi:trk system potassium uptake protein TrkA
MKRKQFLIIGLGRFGSGVANTLYDLGHEVVAMDASEDPVQENMNRVTHAVVADATDEATLRDIGVSHFDAVIVAIGANVEANIYATLAAKDAGAKYIVCKAMDGISKRILEKIGADKVIRPEFDSGVELAYGLASPKLLAQIELTDDVSVIELEASSEITGRLDTLTFAKQGVQIIAHARGTTVRTALTGETEIKLGDKLVLLGRNTALERLRETVGD